MVSIGSNQVCASAPTVNPTEFVKINSPLVHFKTGTVMHSSFDCDVLEGNKLQKAGDSSQAPIDLYLLMSKARSHSQAQKDFVSGISILRTSPRISVQSFSSDSEPSLGETFWKFRKISWSCCSHTFVPSFGYLSTYAYSMSGHEVYKIYGLNWTFVRSITRCTWHIPSLGISG